MIDPRTASTPPNVTRSQLSDAASGAVLALAGQLCAQQPESAYRRALRALVAERLYNEFTAPSFDGSVAPPRVPTALVVACAALSDDTALSEDNALSGDAAEPLEALGSPAGTLRSLIRPTTIDRFDGLCEVIRALDHQHEQWDGHGSPHGVGGVDIPLSARIVSVCRVVVGSPTVGEVPDWNAARARVHERAGSALDPSLCQALERVELHTITPPEDPLGVVATLLNQPTNTASRSAGTSQATTISTAVTLAGRIPDLLNLFAGITRSSVDAAEVVIFRSSDTRLHSTPAAQVTDGQRPLLDTARLDDLFEFAMQAELLAGVTVVRPITSDADDADDAHGDASDTSDTENAPVHEIIAPIMHGGKAWGVLVVTRRASASEFTDVDVAQVEQIAAQISIAARSTSHWAEMEQMALKDQLTGLGNRHDLYRVLDSIFERPLGERRDSALIMCDVDGLKIVNDTLGHHAGDRLLIDAAEALKGAVRNRPGTTVCRIGGDEFCVVVDGGALLTVHEIRDAIERLFARSAGSGPARSISCGIAVADESIDSRSALLRAADENQYETKRERKRSQLTLPSQTLPPKLGRLDSADRRAIRD